MKREMTAQQAASETRNKIKRAVTRERRNWDRGTGAFAALSLILAFIENQAKRADAKTGGLGRKKDCA